MADLFSWAVIAFLVALFIGAAGAVVGMSPPHYSLARWMFSIAAIIILPKLTLWLVSAQLQRSTRLAVGFVIFGVVGAAWVETMHWLSGLEAASEARSQPTTQSTDIAIFMQTRMVPLPVNVPGGGTINVVSLNKRRITSPNAVNWGFYSVQNDAKTGRGWPDKRVMERAKKAKNPAVFAWAAEVSNHGAKTVLDVKIPIKLWFGNEKSEVVYDAIVSPLPAGSSFVFYLVNDCPVQVSGVWPDTTTLQVLGEATRREVPLKRKYISPIDQIMLFFPSSTTLVGDHPCEQAPTK